MRQVPQEKEQVPQEQAEGKGEGGGEDYRLPNCPKEQGQVPRGQEQRQVPHGQR